MKTILALLSLIAFSECFAHRGDFQSEEQEFWDHHHRDFHHVPHPRHFYPGVPVFKSNGFDPSIHRDIITNTIPHGPPPCYAKRIPNDFNERNFNDRAFGTSQERKADMPTEILAKTDKALERTTKSYIVGDFVFPDQVDSYRKKFQASDPALKITPGMQRGLEDTMPDMENRNSLGMGRCPAGKKRFGAICVPIGHH